MTELNELTDLWKIQGYPKQVGKMEILPDVFFHVRRKPLWLHRMMARLIFGWKWTDFDND